MYLRSKRVPIGTLYEFKSAAFRPPKFGATRILPEGETIPFRQYKYQCPGF
ncbi:hypothetical protein PEPS_29430 (plasmid) [Persicobacter psychrovividus]|uniref:Uncharacterized protein n=1 Tax=Persicobacter psychrovividus TaxID=387638 RepID=A0ABN6LBS8_9BACT|nr:hypothetical protein PEPS_29430 [Persicobacter psychrovividus]